MPTFSCFLHNAISWGGKKELFKYKYTKFQTDQAYFQGIM